MTNSSIHPIPDKERIAIVDILRGWALLGVALMNYCDYFFAGIQWSQYKPDPVSGTLLVTSQVIFSAKSWTLLSVLFGYGFSVLISNVAAKGIDPVRFFSRRMFWLLVLSVINSMLFWGDILKDYAVMGMILLLFRKVNAKTSLIISICLLLIAPAVVAWIQSLGQPNGLQLLAPHFPMLTSHNPLKVLLFGLIGTYYYEFVNLSYLVSVHVIMLSCFFFGMAAQKSGFLQKLAYNKKNIKRIVWISLGTTLLVMTIMGMAEKFKWTFTRYYNPFYLVILGSMLVIGCTLCWLHIDGRLKAFYAAMQVIGKMTLTNYITQNFIALVLFSGAGFGFVLEKRLHIGYYLLFALCIYTLQVYFSKWWLRRYHYGPVEWLWRQLSYGKKLPNRKFSEEVSALQPQ